MSLLTDLRAHLVADSGVSAITNRIRMYRSEQADASPRIVLHKISGDHKQHMTAATGKAIARIQIDCHGSSPVNSEVLAEAIRRSLDGFRGSMNSGTYISMCHLEDERTQYIPPLEGEHADGGVDSVQLDYLLGWSLSVPTFA